MQLIRKKGTWGGSILGVAIALQGQPTAAQISPELNSTNTSIRTTGNGVEIVGGALSGDGSNLFHSFQQFGLSPNQVANFISNPTLQNILVRVVGGNASQIDGTLQVTGGPANLYLINPSGILFGPTASLDVGGSFTATTANGLGIGTNWFSAVGNQNYLTLQGTPNAFVFAPGPVGSLVNTASLMVANGNITLVGGTVLSSGPLLAANGSVAIATVSGQPNSTLVRLTPVGSLLSLEIQPLSPNPTNPPNTIPRTLAELLTGGGTTITNAAGAIVDPFGNVQLVGSGLAVGPGDLATQQFIAAATTLAARNNVIAQGISTPGDIAIQSSGSVALNQIQAGNVTINTPGATVLTALNATSVQTDPLGSTQLGGTITTIGNQIYGDAVFATGEVATLTNSAGSIQFLGSVDSAFQSFQDLAIAAQDSILFASPVGALQPLTNLTATASTIQIQDNISVQAGQTYTGTVEIGKNRPIPADITLITENGAITLNGAVQGGNRAPGLTVQAEYTTFNQSVQGLQNLTVQGRAVLGGNVSTVGDQTYTGPLQITSPDITFQTRLGTIRFDQPLDSGEFLAALQFQLGLGNLVLAEIGANRPFQSVAITTIAPFTLSQTITTQGGNVTIQAGQLQSLGSAQIRTQGGDIAFTSATSLDVAQATLDPRSTRGPSGAIALTAHTDLATGDLSTASATTGGPITLTSATGTITTGNLDTSGSIGGGDILVNARTQIETGTLNSSATIGDAGNITLDPINDVIVAWIDAQGGIRGQGGTVDITAGRYFQATASFRDRNGFDASISTAGGLGGGDITIRHDGGPLGEPFRVGAPLLNGTQGLITTGTDNVLARGSVYPDAYTQGNIRLATPPRPLGPILENLPDGRVEAMPPLPTEDLFEDPADLDLPDDDLSTVFTADLDHPLDIDLGTENQDAEFAQEFGDYLGLETESLALTYPDIRNIAATIAAETGRKPAFVYVSFLPDGQRTQAKQDTDPLELLLVTAQGEPIRRVIYAAPRAQVMQVAAAFRSGVTDRTSQDYLEQAQQLYTWLIAPLAEALETRQIDHLLFLMDGGLRSLPLAALHDGHQFLVEKYSLGMAPSLSLVNTRYVDIKTTRLLAMGTSQFKTQSPLPAVPVELAIIAQNFPHGESLLDADFTISNLQAKRRQTPYGIIHLATHGEFKPGAPEESYIQFWDRPLMLNQIRQLGLSNPPVELLVLSACRTALGDDQAELGFAGLAAQAGVKSALASLWYVSDEGTLALMTEFYDQLRRPTVKLKVEALRQAQLSMLHGKVAIANGFLSAPALAQPLALPPAFTDWYNNELAHPYYWAAFTMIGNPW
jgi:filamentous hemagglutinin family protein